MKRLLTAAVAIPLALAAVFGLPAAGFLLVVVVLIELAVVEYVGLGRRIAPGAPLAVLWIVVPVAALAAGQGVLGWLPELPAWDVTVAAVVAVPLGFGSLALFARTPPAVAVGGLGLLAFGLPYFVVPIVSLSHLQSRDPWLLLLLLAIVWLGDSAAFYLGSRWGRRKLAPVMSPNKSWEGAIAGLVASVVAALLWCLLRDEPVSPALLVLAAVTALAAQIGDLVESMFKRAAGVKDSGTLLPGHGGVLDRVDALLLAAPVWHLGLRYLGLL